MQNKSFKIAYSGMLYEVIRVLKKLANNGYMRKKPIQLYGILTYYTDNSPVPSNKPSDFFQYLTVWLNYFG